MAELGRRAQSYGLRVQPTEPTNITTNVLWVDTSITPHVLKRYDNGVWRPVGSSGTSGGAPPPYEHNQVTPAATWTIDHGLGSYPSVTVVDSGNNVVVGDVHYVDDTELTVTFSVPFGGKAYLN